MIHSPGFIAIVNRAKKTISEISVEELQALLRTPNTTTQHIIDVREKEEWDAGHIPCAVHLSKGIIERDIEKIFPEKNKTLILYCGGGSRSALAACNLDEMGYTKIFSLAGGYRAWATTVKV
jgi:rhodanese-related sulfurtransferase